MSSQKVGLLYLCLLLASCATSTETRKVPGQVLDVMQVAAGARMSSYVDGKTQIAVSSHLPADMDCLSQAKTLLAEIRGPSDKLMATGVFDSSGGSTLIAEAPFGKYVINLVSSRTSQKIASIEFESTEAKDRFDFYFQKCQ